ncbi:HMG domain-containing protein 3 [Holothuria leucospilota]|uniref:HMG domain-containing protein 3 n=1 Tax=Holothuria leucospilota TaxID=206669 RepID=A0A9Q0YMW5_HOLLE|nr:HMG domain-containing protein 3 [Holothuria leucospilota]
MEIPSRLDAYNSRLAATNNSMHRVCKDYGVNFVQWCWGPINGVNGKVHRHMICRDGVHLSRQGARVMAKAISATIPEFRRRARVHGEQTASLDKKKVERVAAKKTALVPTNSDIVTIEVGDGISVAVAAQHLIYRRSQTPTEPCRSPSNQKKKEKKKKTKSVSKTDREFNSIEDEASFWEENMRKSESKDEGTHTDGTDGTRGNDSDNERQDTSRRRDRFVKHVESRACGYQDESMVSDDDASARTYRTGEDEDVTSRASGEESNGSKAKVSDEKRVGNDNIGDDVTTQSPGGSDSFGDNRSEPTDCDGDSERETKASDDKGCDDSEGVRSSHEGADSEDELDRRTRNDGRESDSDEEYIRDDAGDQRSEEIASDERSRPDTTRHSDGADSGNDDVNSKEDSAMNPDREYGSDGHTGDDAERESQGFGDGAESGNDDEKGTGSNEESAMNPDREYRSDGHTGDDAERESQGFDNFENRQGRTFRKAYERKECPECGQDMLKININRHMKSKHAMNIQKSGVLVDIVKCIFLVRKTSKGVDYPIHVQRKLHDSSPVIFCESKQCMIEIGIARNSNLRSYQCEHLKRVDSCDMHPQFVNLSDFSLNELSKDGPHCVISGRTLKKVKELHTGANENGVPLIVQFPGKKDSRFQHFSVYNKGIDYYARLGRCIVTYDSKEASLSCGCCRQSRSCVHKAICLWYLNECMTIPDINLEDDGGAFVGDVIYPPTDGDTIKSMCDYIQKHKCVPWPVPTAYMRKGGNYPREFIPAEKDCSSCGNELSQPIKITDKASILSSEGILKGVITYCKVCTECHMPFRYQEYVDGVHNFNDIFLISLELLDRLEKGLECSIALGRHTELISKQLNIDIRPQNIINAFMHFQSMCKRMYHFNCVICGYHPEVVILDVDKKGAFRCNISDVELPDESEESDIEDCDLFWDDVEKNMLATGFLGQDVNNPYDVGPSYTHWSPYIGRNTRSDTRILNTEHRKVHRGSRLLKRECREFTQERLIEILYNSNLTYIRQIGIDVGLRGVSKMTKIDIIRKIRDTLSKDDTKFDKLFTKLQGSSGGWASMVCPHGIVYAIKFLLRAESPRDIVDLVQSMKHTPNVVVVDMANMVAAHGNKRFPGMFHPHNGMLAEPSSDNLRLVKSDDFVVNLPWIAEHKERHDTSGNVHPVTGSNEHYCLFDRLHEGNVKGEFEILRRVRFVPELCGKLNTQAQEQLHSEINKNNYFLNQMTPVKYIFLFRSIVDLRNREKNRIQLAKVQKNMGSPVTLDEFGRLGVTFAGTPMTDRNRNEHQEETNQEDPKSPSSAPTDLGDVPSRGKKRTQAEPQKPPSTRNKRRKKPDMWLPHLHLTENERAILLERRWLNDLIINAGQEILKASMPVGGLQNTLLMQSTGFEPVLSEFVQIVNLTNSHWVLISNIGVPEPHIRLYDSSTNARKRYPLDMIKAAACLLQTKESSIIVNVMNVTQQNDGSSCGVFALAFAATLCAGQDPTKMHYDENTMWTELIDNLNNLEMLPFGIKGTNRVARPKRISLIREGIFCTCRRPDDGNKMAECKFCKEWFHQACEGPFTRRDFYCSFCSRRFDKRKVAASNDRMNGVDSYRALQRFKKRYGIHKWHAEAERMYKFVNDTALNGAFPDADRKLAVTEKLPEHLGANIKGITITRPDDPSVGFNFIYIRGPKHLTLISLYETLVHEMAHAKYCMDGGRSASHNKAYKRVGKNIIEVLNANSHRMPVSGVANCKLHPRIFEAKTKGHFDGMGVKRP